VVPSALTEPVALLLLVATLAFEVVRPRGLPKAVVAIPAERISVLSDLAAERDLGRIAADADVDTLAPTLIGAGHLLFADRTGTPPEAGAVRKMVTTVLVGALPR
jgi:hypothetical protein